MQNMTFYVFIAFVIDFAGGVFVWKFVS